MFENDLIEQIRTAWRSVAEFRNREEMVENGEIDPWEAAFMSGWEEAGQALQSSLTYLTDPLALLLQGHGPFFTILVE